MYATLSKLKTDLGISDTSQDTILTQMCNDADAYLNSMLQIDGFDRATITEQIRMRGASNSWNTRIYLSNFNVQAISKINGTAYTGVLNTDYFIEGSRTIIIKDLYKYLSTTNVPLITVEYSYGRVRSPEALPADIELMTRLLVAGLYSEKYPMGYSASPTGTIGMGNITDYKLGDEQIKIGAKFGANGTSVSFRDEESRSQFQQLFTKYKKAYVV